MSDPTELDSCMTAAEYIASIS